MSGIEVDWRAGLIPCAVRAGDGTWHPALQNGRKVWHWPNITMPTYDEAVGRAWLSLADAVEPANKVIEGWNVVQSHG